jgi:hypothetical protein
MKAHAEKAEYGFNLGVVILPYNRTKQPFIRPRNATELSVL